MLKISGIKAFGLLSALTVSAAFITGCNPEEAAAPPAAPPAGGTPPSASAPETPGDHKDSAAPETTPAPAPSEEKKEG